MSGKLKEVRLRIKSVKSTAQITNAMKLVAAAKLRKATEGIQKMRPYSSKLNYMLSNIVASEEELEIDYAIERPVNNVLLVVVTSDRGLAGSYNSNIIKQARGLMLNEYNSQYEAGNVTVLNLGKKGFEGLKKMDKARYVTDDMDVFTNLSFEESGKIAVKIMNAYADKRYDAVRLVFAKFKNAATQINTDEAYLPIAKPEADESQVSTVDYIYEPEKMKMINLLVPKILKTQLYRVLLDANASEQGARMTSMDQATENAKEMLRDLKIEYNRARQAAITTELTEIVSGAAALENG